MADAEEKPVGVSGGSEELQIGQDAPAAPQRQRAHGCLCKNALEQAVEEVFERRAMNGDVVAVEEGDLPFE